MLLDTASLYYRAFFLAGWPSRAGAGLDDMLPGLGVPAWLVIAPGLGPEFGPEFGIVSWAGPFGGTPASFAS